MSVYGTAFWSQLDGNPKTNPIVASETHWGLIIKNVAGGKSGGFFAEGVLKILAIVMLFGSILPWAFTSGALGQGALMTQMSLSAAFFVTGFGVYSHAGRGFRQEVHIDGIQSEVRFAARNSRDISSIRRRIPMMHVQSCFMTRTNGKTGAAQLHLRLKSSNQTLVIASGLERNLVPILKQMADLIKVTKRRSRLQH